MTRNRDDDSKQVDRLIGQRILELRLVLGWPRVKLAEKIGVTHQQLQKYEKGMNRICVSRLLVIAKAMGKSVEYFIDTLDPEETLPTQHHRMSMEVSRNFLRIKNPVHQNAVNVLVRSLTEEKQ